MNGDYPTQIRQDHITGFWYVIDTNGQVRDELYATEDDARAGLVGAS